MIKELEKEMSTLMKSNGYKKKGTTWYKETNEVISVLNLQKSKWGEQVYINFGAFVKQLQDGMQFPKEYQCHVRFRLEDLIEDKKQFEMLTNFEDNSIGHSEKIKLILNEIQINGFKALNQFDSVENVKKFAINNKKDPNIRVIFQLKAFLGIN
jgi:hypothetical protein